MKVALQGDEHIPEYRLVAIDIDSGRLQAAHYPKVPIVRNSGGFFHSRLGWWSTDNRHAYFVDMARGYQTVRVVEFDTFTGNTRVLFEETSETHLNLMVNEDELPTIMPLPETKELIWFSERSGWAHLYLYDLTTGELKNAITSGEWCVRNILSVNPQRREVFLHTMGRTPNRDPYYRDIVRVNLDTGALTEIAASDDDYFAASDHCFDMETNGFAMTRDIAMARSVSHSGKYVVATRSRVDTVPVTVLLDRDGKALLELEQGDMTTLYARVSRQWQWPEPVQLMAADNTSPIYGVVWRPSDFSPDQSYPVISSGFNTPELPRVPKGSFTNSSSGGAYYCSGAALAELGFIVVQIDARGTPFRGKAFQDTSYGWAESAGCIDDHVAGIKQLAERYPYMDLDRVGISSLGGGTGAVQGLLQHPKFFKVGVHGSLHDSRLMATPLWSDKYEGLVGSDSKEQYPEAYAENLQGKLLLMCGMLDFCTLPANTFRVVEALQKANKDFDLIMLPSLGHGMSQYLVRRAWDYLVRHLLNEEPPAGFDLEVDDT
jgi:dipeptidyl aminopeptidase/acylaminoacyl peptidase